MLKAINHRGPDNQSYFLETLQDKSICLGHVRLSIIDLSDSANQPFHFEHLSIVFNGEIYNYKQIKKNLSNQGISFSTSSDTEVLIKAIFVYGIERALEECRGMFAFALLNRKDESISLVRDRAGVKPLYYSVQNGSFLFASETKSLVCHKDFKRNIDLDALSFYFKTGAISATNSVYQNTMQVQPGSYVSFKISDLQKKEVKYWDVADFYSGEEFKGSYEEAKADLEKILIESVKLRMVADVPVGVFLSGGYDSCLTSALLMNHTDNNLNTFTIGFEDKEHDEAQYAKEIAKHLGTKHKELYCNENDALNMAMKLDSIFDEPFADSSAIPTLLVSEFSAKDVKVVLSSDGGDESFWGYTKYGFLEKIWKYRDILPSFSRPLLSSMLPSDLPLKKYNLKTRLDKISKIIKETEPEKNLLVAQQILSDSEIKSLFPGFKITSNGNYIESSFIEDPYKRVSSVDYKTYLCDDILAKVDRTTMSVSIEGREPLLDHKIIEFAASLPLHYKCHNGVTKRILRDITHQYIPKEMIDRPKHGFSAPIGKWFQSSLKDELYESLRNKDFLNLGLLNQKSVEKEISSFLKDPELYNAQKIWLLFMFSKWCTKWKPSL